jgi:protein-disulfide isomerase
MSEGGKPAGLTSADLPPVSERDHVRGSGPEAIVYLDLACPVCAAAWARIRGLELRLCVRHFPVASKRPRALALHAAVEAAGRQRPEAFWQLWDSIYADQAHIDDPHLWERARLVDLDLERFDADRRSREIAERVRVDFEGGIRAGVAGTPAAFAAGRPLGGDPVGALAELAAAGGSADGL